MERLELVINVKSTQSLYEQIEDQIRRLILGGMLEQGEMLPSVRALSQELGVSIITTRRAYTELEQQGFVETVPAKGTFVSGIYLDRMKHMGLSKLRELTLKCVLLAKSLDLPEEEMSKLVQEFYQQEMDVADDMQIVKAVQMIHKNRLF